MLIVFMVFSKLVKGLGLLRALRKLGSRLLRPRKIPVKNFFFSIFDRLKKELMALCKANIYLLNLKQKVESSFGLHGDSFLDDLLLGVFSMVVLLNLGTHGGS